MTINQLKAFVTVCDYMNYTVAAEKLYMTRQALRQNISALERELDTPLFVMQSNRLALSSAGGELLNECKDVLVAFETMEKKVFNELKYGKKLRICVSTALVPDYLPFLMQMLDKYALKEHLHFDITSVENTEVSRLVEAGEADCGLVMDMRSCMPELERREVSAHASSMLVANNHHLYNRNSVSVTELEGEKICLPGDSIEFAPFFRAYKDAGIKASFYYFPSFYQVYYNVRDKGYIALNRYNPAENPEREYADDIILDDMPPLCSAFITRESPSKELISLYEYLKAYYNDFFAL